MLASNHDAVLAQGGDERSALDPTTGKNRYGCWMRPQPETAGWSSCTASSPSPRALEAAWELRARLVASPEAGLAEGARLSASLLELVGAPADAVDCVLVPSGTDAEYVPLALMLGEGDAGIANVLVGDGELGSATALAARALHCASVAPSTGAPLAKGSAVEGFPPGFVALRAVRVRDEVGAPRPADAIARDVKGHVTDALGRGQRVLLHLVDSSKTGVRAPSLEQVDALVASAPDRVRVVVDAAQGRLGDGALRGYLTRGFTVIFSASKFYGGPSFCGAVLIPRAPWGALRGPIPEGLQHYLAQCAVPAHWAARGSIASVTNASLLLRWAAGLAEMRAYRGVAASVRRSVLAALVAAIEAAGARFSSIEPVVTPARDEGSRADNDDDGLSSVQTIATFRLRAGGAYLDFAEVRRIRELMHEASAPAPASSFEPCARGDGRFLLGQAVELSPTAAALRVAISAPQVTAIAEGAPDERAIASRLGAASDELVALFEKLHRLVVDGARGGA